jgi:hypothetical protein
MWQRDPRGWPARDVVDSAEEWIVVLTMRLLITWFTVLSS